MQSLAVVEGDGKAPVNAKEAARTAKARMVEMEITAALGWESMINKNCYSNLRSTWGELRKIYIGLKMWRTSN